MKQLLALLLIFTPYVLCAQIQRGYVRTAGNENEKGQVLEGVLIRAEGLSPVVSDKNGIFTLALPNIETDGDAFRIISVRKSNFELLNKDALNAQFTYSASVPIEIVMISSELMELRSICDNIAIVSEGTVVDVLPVNSSDADFGLAMSGIKPERGGAANA